MRSLASMPDPTTADGRRKAKAMYLALAVRNAMEGTFHGGPRHLIDDDRMPEFNRLVRDAIYTMLTAFDEGPKKRWAELTLEWYETIMPAYWELPELTDSARRSMREFPGPAKRKWT